MKSNQLAGRHGEERVLSYLQEALHNQSAYVLHDFHMRIPNAYSIQIDFIIFTKSYILLLEVKNIKGHIRLQHAPPQLVRTLDGIVQAMDCPFTQMTRNVMHFKKLLGNQPLPVYTAIVWANRSAVIDPLMFEAPHPLLFVKQLPAFISYLPNEESENVSLRTLVKRIQSKATPFWQTNMCERYSVSPLDLLNGMQCMACYSMAKLFEKTWVCMNCKCRVNSMLPENICLLFHFMGENLSMQMLQQLIPSLRSRNLQDLIQSKRLQISGNRRNRSYHTVTPKQVTWMEINYK